MQKLIEAGELTEEEAEQSERRNIILQALGPEATIKVDLTHQRVRRGDVLVLCSDGLSGQVRGDEIARIVSEEKDLVAACKHMIDRANENGGPDNITVIAARFDGAGLAAPDTTDDVGHRIYPLATDSGPVDAVPRDPGMRTTAEMEAVRRPTRELPVDAFLIPPPRDESAAKRRMRGSLIALALLLVFIAAATWYVWHVGTQVVAPRHGGTPTPTDTRP
jgi:hypothetical protein